MCPQRSQKGASPIIELSCASRAWLEALAAPPAPALTAGAGAGFGAASFGAASVPATLARTTLGTYEVGREVNLERALAAGQPLGGHIVQGHVDDVASVLGVDPVEDGVRLRIRLTPDVARVTVPRGSLAVDGVSLTVAELSGEVAEIAIIPYTLSHTSFGRLRAGATVNVEADLIGKYVEKLVRPHLANSSD